MHLEEIDCLLAEVSKASNHRHFVLIGSLSILGALREPPPEMTLSIDVDLFLKFDPGRDAELHAFGENSAFHREHGFYADPVSPHLASLPPDWESRLLQTPLPSGTVLWCLDPNDAAVAKYWRGTARDREWARAGLLSGILDSRIIAKRMAQVQLFVAAEEPAAARQRLDEDLKQLDWV